MRFLSRSTRLNSGKRWSSARCQATFPGGRRESVPRPVQTLGWLGQQVSANAPSDPCGRRLDGIPREVGIAGGRLDLGMPEELADHGVVEEPAVGSGGVQDYAAAPVGRLVRLLGTGRALEGAVPTSGGPKMAHRTARRAAASRLRLIAAAVR